MSHVPEADNHIYRGEDWTMLASFYDDDAPTEAEFEDWDAFMEIRTARGTLLVRCTTTEGDGFITREMNEETPPEPTFRVRIPKATTRGFPVGTHKADLFVVPGAGDTFPLFVGEVVVSNRVTIEEGP